MRPKTAPATKTTDSDGPKVNLPKRCLEAPAYPPSRSIHNSRVIRRQIPPQAATARPTRAHGIHTNLTKII